MIDFNKYKEGDYVKFLPSTILETLIQKHKGIIRDDKYVKAVINLGGKTCKIGHKFCSGSLLGITLDGDNPNYYYAINDKWLFKQWMFEDPCEIEPNINNNIPNIFGDMIYNN